MEKTTESINRLSNGSVEIINLVIPKPDIPPDIAENYKQVSLFRRKFRDIGIGYKSFYLDRFVYISEVGCLFTFLVKSAVCLLGKGSMD